MLKTKSLFVIGALLIAAAPALAQKSKDMLRYPIDDAEATLDRYVAPGSFANQWEPAIFDNLIGFDPKKGQFTPQLAKAWKQIDPLTFEFELRDDVKFQNGEKFDADDMVYTLNYLIDPKVKLRYKPSWAWIKSIEKLSPYKVRINAKEPDPDGLMWLAFGTPMYPDELHGGLADKQAFGPRPVGTGPYRITKLDKNTGVVAEKYAGFVPGPMKPAPQIGRIVAQPIPDVGSLVANLLTDQVDVAVNLPMDQAIGLRESGRFEITLSPPRLGYIYLQFPTAAWTNVKQLADVRVRTAIAMAINRKVLLQSVYGPLAQGLIPTEGLCSKEQLGCGYTKMVPDYDPAGAKKLLAEAGYPNGFEISISGYRENTPHMTAISGMLREVGIRANVKIHHSTQRLKMIQDGQVEIGYYGWSGGNMFTVSPQIVRHLQAGEYEDPEFVKLVDPIFKTMDDTERRKLSARAFDRLHDMAYTYPMITNREIFVHTKEVAIRDPNDLRPMIISPHEFVWK